jgi:hypothetical protein
MSRSTQARLADYERDYRQLTERICEIGYIAAGSITHRYTRCGSTGCRCHADPPQPHGPYWQWTAKINGKTVTRRLTDAEARLYQQWIDNDRQLRALIEQMRDVSVKATRLIMQGVESPQAKV